MHRYTFVKRTFSDKDWADIMCEKSDGGRRKGVPEDSEKEKNDLYKVR